MGKIGYKRRKNMPYKKKQRIEILKERLKLEKKMQ